MLILEPCGSSRRPSDKPIGTMSAELPLTNCPPTPTISAPSSGKSTVWDTTRWRASVPSNRIASPLPPESRYAPSNAVPPPSGKLMTAPNSDLVNARYGALKLGTPVACAWASETDAAPTNSRQPARNHRIPAPRDVVRRLPDAQRGDPMFPNAALMEGRSMLRPYY